MRCWRAVPRAEIFARTGIQFMPINTIYQLAAHVRDGLAADAAGVLLMPDSVSPVPERLAQRRVHRRHDDAAPERDDAAVGRHAVRAPRAAARADAGAGRSGRRPRRAAAGARMGRSRRPPAIRVIAPATHDTASAVVGTPLTPGWAFISSGTWSLVGVERAAPLLTGEAEAANFTNEGGAGGTIRFLKNVMGLWVLRGVPARVGQRRPRHRCARRRRRRAVRAGRRHRRRRPRPAQPAEHDSRDSRAARRDRTARPRDADRAGARGLRLARARLRAGGGDDRAPDRRGDPGHPHRRRRLAQRLPEPGDRRTPPASRSWPGRSRRRRPAT